MADLNVTSYENIYSEIKETLLLSVENDQARQWYMDEAIASAWSSRQLERQISTLYYERFLASRDQLPELPVKAEADELTAPLAAENFIKDPYVLEFFDLKNYPALRESDLEQALLDKLQEFLLELGLTHCTKMMMTTPPLASSCVPRKTRQSLNILF